MNPNTVAVIRRAILEVLSDCGHYLLASDMLLLHVRGAAGMPLTTGDLEEQLRWLQSNQMIVGVTPELGGVARWRITDIGRTALLT